MSLLAEYQAQEEEEEEEEATPDEHKQYRRTLVNQTVPMY